MSFFQKLKRKYLYVQYFLQYCYEVTNNNYFAYQLIGERISIDGEYIIIYQRIGNNTIHEIPLRCLLGELLLYSFSPKDTFKLGVMAFDSMFSNDLNNEKKAQFMEVRDIMLSSIHDVCFRTIKSYFFDNNLSAFRCNETESLLFNDVNSNKFPCKLVGGFQCDKASNTTICYTILGRRDGYECKLADIVKSSSMLEKFHPTEAVKFGFIFAGETKMNKVD